MDTRATLRFQNTFKSEEDMYHFHKWLLDGHNTGDLVPAGSKLSTYRRRARAIALDDDTGDLCVPQTGQRFVPPSRLPAVLAALYKQPDCPRGGVVPFYKWVNYVEKRLVKKSDCAAFLAQQPEYQMRTLPHATTPKPILSKALGDLLCIDLVDMTRYKTQNGGAVRGYCWIVTIVDAFSGYVWLGRTRQKTPEQVRDEFARLVPADLSVRSVLSDQGNEFKGAFQAMLDLRRIVHRTTAPHTPTANGMAESKNRAVRDALRTHFVQTNKLHWVGHLPNVAAQLNNSYSAARKNTPRAIFDSRVLVDNRTNRRRAHEQQSGAAQYMARKAAVYDHATLDVGDYVRVRMAALYSGVRAALKNPLERKSITVHWTPDIYRIVHRTAVKGLGGHFAYTVQRVRDDERPNTTLRLADLLKVDGPHANDGARIQTAEQAMTINQTWFVPRSDNIDRVY